jgi:hypothetical protein
MTLWTTALRWTRPGEETEDWLAEAVRERGLVNKLATSPPKRTM